MISVSLFSCVRPGIEELMSSGTTDRRGVPCATSLSAWKIGWYRPTRPAFPKNRCSESDMRRVSSTSSPSGCLPVTRPSRLEKAMRQMTSVVRRRTHRDRSTEGWWSRAA